MRVVYISQPAKLHLVPNSNVAISSGVRAALWASDRPILVPVCPARGDLVGELSSAIGIPRCHTY